MSKLNYQGIPLLAVFLFGAACESGAVENAPSATQVSNATTSEGDGVDANTPQRTVSIARPEDDGSPIILAPGADNADFGPGVEALLTRLTARRDAEIAAAEQMPSSPKKEELLYEKREYVDLFSRPAGPLTITGVKQVYEANYIYFKDDLNTVQRELTKLGSKQSAYSTEGEERSYGATVVEIAVE